MAESGHFCQFSQNRLLIKTRKIPVFHVLGHGRIISESQSAANLWLFDKTDKISKIECDWVGVLQKCHFMTPFCDTTRVTPFEDYYSIRPCLVDTLLHFCQFLTFWHKHFHFGRWLAEVWPFWTFLSVRWPKCQKTTVFHVFLCFIKNAEKPADWPTVSIMKNRIKQRKHLLDQTPYWEWDLNTENR